jgi:hypothetical protein
VHLEGVKTRFLSCQIKWSRGGGVGRSGADTHNKLQGCQNENISYRIKLGDTAMKSSMIQALVANPIKLFMAIIYGFL